MLILEKSVDADQIHLSYHRARRIDAEPITLRSNPVVIGFFFSINNTPNTKPLLYNDLAIWDVGGLRMIFQAAVFLFEKVEYWGRNFCALF